MTALARHATPRIATPRLLFLYPRCAQHRLLGALSGVQPRDISQPLADSPPVVRPVEGAPHSTSPSSTQTSEPASQRRLLESPHPGPPPPVPKANRPRPRLRASKAAITLVCLIQESGFVLLIRNDGPLTNTTVDTSSSRTDTWATRRTKPTIFTSGGEEQGLRGHVLSSRICRQARQIR